MEKIAFFDFCETLVDFQTADAFVHFIRKRYGNKRMKRLNRVISFLCGIYILPIIEKVIPNKSINKRLVLSQLKGLTQDKIEQYAFEYYNEKIKPHEIHQLIEQLHKYQKEGYRIVLVSGGYDKYLRFFAEDNNIVTEDIISTKIDFHNGVCSGKIAGLDCMGRNKISLLEQKFVKKDISSVSFSDSKTDLPMLLWTDDCYVVSHNKKQQWAIDNNLKEIVWV